MKHSTVWDNNSTVSLDPKSNIDSALECSSEQPRGPEQIEVSGDVTKVQPASDNSGDSVQATELREDILNVYNPTPLQQKRHTRLTGFLLNTVFLASKAARTEDRDACERLAWRMMAKLVLMQHFKIRNIERPPKRQRKACARPDIWERGKCAEEEIGYTIIKGTSLEELEPLFARMKRAGIEPTEHIPPGKFWANVRRVLRDAAVKHNVPESCMGLPPNEDESSVPCECAQ